MADIATQANDVYRDFSTTGVPASGPNEPDKASVRALFSAINSAINASIQGMASYATAADLPTDPAPDEGAQARVYADPTSTNNVVWKYADGAWAIDDDFYSALAKVIQPDVDAVNAVAGQITQIAATVEIGSGGKLILFDHQRALVKYASADEETVAGSTLLRSDDGGFSISGPNGETLFDTAWLSARIGSAELAQVGALTDTGFTVTADILAPGMGRTQIEVATDAAFTNRAFVSTPVFPNEAPAGSAGNYRTAMIPVSGLRPATQYHYRFIVDGNVGAAAGTITTAPKAGVAADYSFAVGSCDDQRPFTDFPSMAAAAALAPLMFVHLGDHGYFDVEADNILLQRGNYRYMRTVPAVAALLASTAFEYIFDNHDSAGPSQDLSAYAGTTYAQVVANSAQALREITPGYPLAGFGLARAWSVANDRHILMDTVTFRQAGVHVIGDAQMQWVKDQLTAAHADGCDQVFLYSPENWGMQGMGWLSATGGSPAEQTALCDFIRDNLPAHYVTLVCGDEHYCAVDDGTNSDYSTGGGLKMMQILSSGLASAADSVMALHTFTWDGATSSFHDNQQAFVTIDSKAGGGWTARVWGAPYTGTTATLLGSFNSSDITG